MADKYHINPDTGRANQCTAKRKCRFGAETKHYATKEEARGAYEKSMKSQTVSKPLKKTAAKTPSKSDTASNSSKELPIIPGVPPVMTAREVKLEREELLEYIGEWGPHELQNFSLKRHLQDEEITLTKIIEAEKSGEYQIETSVPSYYEISISTDLAHHELGWPEREKTGIDETPLRKAQIEYGEAHAGTFGSFRSGEEYNTAQEKAKKAKAAYEALAYPDRKPEPPRIKRANGLYW